jgi:uncharacterized protein (DUF1697 family)
MLKEDLGQRMVVNALGWQMGVAFIRGINIYGNKRISRNKILELCRSIEDEDLRIIKVVKTDNVIFEKREMHYGAVSSRLERVLSNYFGKPIYVTSRSMKTIGLLTRHSRR